MTTNASDTKAKLGVRGRRTKRSFAKENPEELREEKSGKI